uniref:Acyltransferase clz18 n=1 Tax=Cochliobolus lunatus TaxID=5503 RepID=CLZ18_COCLU|nr:RecName: Full=Acyltransferase clz18; Short=AT clz18; AltName: Full=Squalestatin S1 biosynthesis cluster protein clz18; AltName: Full=Zaragozic acid A biosynthesis cluster protein 18 [Curvularia lunata]AXF50661.1 acyltransferase [Curvularia lunata]
MIHKPIPNSKPLTAYIDGLRGLLSIIIFNAHLTPVIILGYDKVSRSQVSTSPRNVLDIPLVASCVNNWVLFTIPILKLVYSASPAVCLFFAISGYVMSLKWVRYMNHRSQTSEINSARIFTDFGSSIFRRTLRLSLLAMASMIVPFALMKTGFFDRTVVQQHGLTKLERGMRFWLEQWEQFPARHESWWEQTCDLVQNCARIFTVFMQRRDEAFSPRYNPVLWTIKADLRASLALTVTHLALLGTKRSSRLQILAALAVLGVAVGSLECPLFWAGWIIAEIHHAAEQTPLAQGKGTGQPRQKTNTAGMDTFGKTVVLALGCYVASYPTWKPEKAPMFNTFHMMTPGLIVPPRTWHSLGAVLVLYSLRDVPLARRICESSVAQFLGTHSFAIYLIHFCLVISFGPDLFSWVWSRTGHENLQSLAVGFGITYSILFMAVLLTAAIFRRFIESPVNKCVDSLYRSASVRKEA